MKKRAAFLQVIFLLFSANLAYSDQITPEQAAKEVSQCTAVLNSAEKKYDSFKELVTLLDSLKSGSEPDSLLSAQKSKENSFRLRLKHLKRRSTSLNKQVSSLGDSYCSPCLKSGINSFCKHSGTLQKELGASMEEFSVIAKKHPSLYSSVYLRTATQMFNDCRKLPENDKKRIGERIESAEKLLSENKHGRVLDISSEVIRALEDSEEEKKE
ncbi:MAG: hypothetical protein ACLFQB_14205 [Chitinispirillaceae bacterium]